METLSSSLQPFSEWLLRTTLQASLLICLILVIQLALGTKLGVRWRYCLWLVLLLRMALPWAPQSRLSISNLIPQRGHPAPIEYARRAVADDSAGSGSPGVGVGQPTPASATKVTKDTAEAPALLPDVGKESGGRLRARSFEVADALPLVWLAGALALAIYVCAGNFSLWRIVKRERSLTDQRILELVEDCKSQMRVRTIIGLVVTDKVRTPALFGFVRPRLLLPRSFIEALDREELRHVFLHELAHLRRHDILVGYLVSILQTLHWFNPLVWLAFHRLRADRELACDALALSTMNTAESPNYGRTIVHLLENFLHRRRLPSLAGISEDKTQIKRRITMIAKFKKGSYRFSAMAAVLLIVLSVVALTNAEGTSGKTEEKKLLAEAFVEMLINEKFEEATHNFDDKVKKALPAARLTEVWKATVAQAGPFERQLGVRSEKWLWSDIIYVTCQFKEGPIDVKVVYNRASKISGLWFVPVPQGVLEGYADETETAPFLWSDNFEDGNLEKWDTISETPSIITSDAHSGTSSLELNGSGHFNKQGGKREDAIIKLFPASPQSVTVEAWVKVTEWSEWFTDVHFAFLANLDNIHEGTGRFWMFSQNSGYYWDITKQQKNFNHNLPRNTWTNLKIEYDSSNNGTIRYYEDGKLQLTIPNSGTDIKGFFFKAGVCSGPVRFLVDDVTYRISTKPRPLLDESETAAEQFQWQECRYPGWSNDGQYIFFAGKRNDTYDLWRMRQDGTDLKRISNYPPGRTVWGVSSRPNSDDIYYLDNSVSGLDFHWIVKTSANKWQRTPILQVPGGDGFSGPSFSPDGSRFCFNHQTRSKTGERYGRSIIKIANADGSNVRSVMEYEGKLGWIAWGRGEYSGKIVYTKPVDGVRSVFMINTDGSNEVRITQKEQGTFGPANFSADGNWLVSYGEDVSICILKPDGSNYHKINEVTIPGLQYAFSPDGTKIAYATKSNDQQNIKVIALKNISLRSGLKTDVEIEMERAVEQASDP